MNPVAHSAARRSWLPVIGAAAAVAAAAGIAFLILPIGSLAPVVDPDPGKGTGPAMCPWREPERDLRAFFADATTYRTDTLALSSIRQDILRRLGPGSQMDSNSLYVHRALKGTKVVGSILVRRVAGPHGAIEVVVAVDTGGRVAAVRLQRHREPDEAGRYITSDAWLKTFRSKTAESLKLELSASKNPTAAVIVTAVWRMLVEFEEAERYYSTAIPPHH